jgi:hypothetical protein
MRKILLACGVLASIHYAAINVYVPSQWEGYSVVDQTVSELSAIGAPTRELWLALAMPFALLFIAFGWGVVKSSAANRRLRTAGWLIVLCGVFNLYWPPMHLREVLAAGGGTLTDTLHLVWAGITTLFFVLIMAFAAAALGRSFRIYTIVSAIALFSFGLLTSLGAQDVEANLPTPWIGVWERINTGVFFVWIIVLAVVLLRDEQGRVQGAYAADGRPSA